MGTFLCGTPNRYCRFKPNPRHWVRHKKNREKKKIEKKFFWKKKKKWKKDKTPLIPTPVNELIIKKSFVCYCCNCSELLNFLDLFSYITKWCRYLVLQVTLEWAGSETPWIRVSVNELIIKNLLYFIVGMVVTYSISSICLVILQNDADISCCRSGGSGPR